METAVVLKESGRQQRADVALTKDIAGALAQSILNGELLYTKSGYMTLHMPDGEDRQLSCMTIKGWITREVVIPETGNTLRTVLDRARADYRAAKREELQKKLIADAEAVLNRTMNIRTNLVQRNMFGQLIKNKDGSLARKESSSLLKVKVDAAKYVTERLDPAKYGKVEKSENKHLVFSLSDLRKARQQQNDTQ